MNLTKELKELIEKNLPSQTAGALSDYLKKAEVAIEEYETAKITMQNLRTALKSETEIKKVLQEQLVSQAELETKLKDIEKREFALDNAILKIKLEEAGRRADVVTSLTETVFKNRRLVIEKTSNVPLSVNAGASCSGYVSNGCGSETETRREE